ncbi:MAG: DUF4252 domain-containing protein [Petrimonas sp.]|jgi:hypothetical protein
MKRLSLILLCGLLSTSVFCQSKVSFEHLYNHFSQEKNVEKVNVGGLLLLMTKPFMKQYANGLNISSVKVMSFNECSQDVKLRFNALAERLNDDKYELLLKANEKDEKTRIFARVQNEAIRELIIVSMGNDPTIVRIKGKIRPEDVQKLVNSNNNEQ